MFKKESDIGKMIHEQVKADIDLHTKEEAAKLEAPNAPAAAFKSNVMDRLKFGRM